MTDQARVVYSYSTSVPDEPGQAFKVLATLVSAGINLLGCSGTQSDGQAHIEVVPADAAAFAALVERATLSFRRQKAGFLIQGDDRPVSYTHLRAHETVLDLVCRLLLEKKKTKRTHARQIVIANRRDRDT